MVLDKYILEKSYIDYFDVGNKTIFIIRTSKYDIVLGSRDNADCWRDVEEAKQVINKIKSLSK